MADFAVPGNTPRLNVISLGVFLLSIALAVWAGVRTQGAAAPIIIMLVGVVAMQSPKIAQQWERGVVLRLGRFVGLRGPGSSGLFVHGTPYLLDRSAPITTGFAAEQTLTSDTVPVNVDAVRSGWCTTPRRRRWKYRTTAPRSVGGADGTARLIGRTALTDCCAAAERIEADLQQLIDQRSTPWGRHGVGSRNADVVTRWRSRTRLSREAAREKQARIILGQAEMEIANSFQQAANSYHENPLHCTCAR